MADLTQKYLDKELVNSIPEVLPPDYDEWLDKMQPTPDQQDEMALMIEAFNQIFGKPF